MLPDPHVDTEAMRHMAAAPEAEVPGLRRGRWALPLRGWLPPRRAAPTDGSAFGFALRLLATVTLTFVLVGIAGYVLLERNLAHKQISEYAASLRADGKAFEREGGRGRSPANALLRIDPLLDSVSRRTGTREAVMIDSHRIVRQALNDAKLGTIDSGPHIDAALEHSRSYAGHESGAAKDTRDFEFVIPINLLGARYAYDVTYDHRTYDAQVAQVRRIVALIGLLGLFGGGAVFYLVGGRRLMRDHRMVLHSATRDGLTDLPNQRAFQGEFPDAVASAARYGDPLALVLLDVDDFKLINDRHGHQQGDSALRVVSGVLRSSRPGDRAYRIGGDEFALLLSHTDAEGARTLTRRLCRDFAEVGVEISMGASGLRPGLAADTLRAEADTALYEAKRQGGNRAAHFEDIRERVVVTTAEKKEAVRRLIDEGLMTTVFQPIWNFEQGSLLGMEALTRPDQRYGLSGPAEAFDVAEQIGRVHQLDVLCVESALKYAPELERGVLMFLNLSPVTLDLDAETDAWLGPAVERAGLRPQEVVVEVTERFGGRTVSVVKQLKRLREQGFKIAVDDVGTGNSGLEMLRGVEAEFVKLDRSIVAAAATEPGARAVLMAMATFARQTGAFVVAEGIEDEDTLEFLRAINERDLSSSAIIQGGQGFGLGRPLPDLSPRSPSLLHDARSRAVQPLGS
jgi:diguanylate cyclase (GGDEF)-like protein